MNDNQVTLGQKLRQITDNADGSNWMEFVQRNREEEEEEERKLMKLQEDQEIERFKLILSRLKQNLTNHAKVKSNSKILIQDTRIFTKKSIEWFTEELQNRGLVVELLDDSDRQERSSWTTLRVSW